MTNNELNTLTLNLAYYILENNSTVRATAKAFNIPKSTVHHMMCNNLKFLNYSLYRKVKKQFAENFKVKHIHGGEATKQKYEKLKQLINCNDQIEFNQEIKY